MNRRSFFFGSAFIASAVPVLSETVFSGDNNAKASENAAIVSGERAAKRVGNGSLTTVYGRRGCGKSSMLVSMAAGWLSSGRRVKFISCELNEQYVCNKIIRTTVSGYNCDNLRVVQSAGRPSDINVLLDEIQGSESAPDIVVIDASAFWGGGYSGVVEKISKMSRELGIQFVVSVPAKREISDREMSDLSINRISTYLAYMSDLILRVDQFSSGVTYVVKNRFGRSGMFISVDDVCERIDK